MAQRRPVVLTLVLGLLIALAAGAGAATTAAGPDGGQFYEASTGGSSQVAPAVQQSEIDPDTVLMQFDIRADGSARGQISFLVALDDQNATDAFESLAADIERNSSAYTDRFGEQLRRTAADAENATGREMAVTNVTVETDRQDLGQEYGVVRYSYTWHGFAATNETAVVAGDALAGFYLDGQTRLRIDWPQGYEATTVTPSPSEREARAVIWRGPQDFGSDGPRVVLQRDGGDSTSALPAAVIAALVAALAVIAVVFARQRGVGPFEDDRPAAAASTGADGGGDAQEPPEELLSNEERVLRLLEDNGGRIKQKEVAERLDWTDAKTSQVVKGLREDDKIDAFRLGRENVLSLPGEDEQ